MKNLAEFKRELTVGSKWKAYNHLFKTNMGTREVGKIQSNAVAFKTDDGLSWHYFDKASLYKFNSNTVNIFWENKEIILTYVKVTK